MQSPQRLPHHCWPMASARFFQSVSTAESPVPCAHGCPQLSACCALLCLHLGRMVQDIAQPSTTPTASCRRAHHSAHFARQSNGCEVAVVLPVLIEVADVDLHAGVVLCRDQLVGPGTARHSEHSHSVPRAAQAPVRLACYVHCLSADVLIWIVFIILCCPLNLPTLRFTTRRQAGPCPSACYGGASPPKQLATIPDVRFKHFVYISSMH